jgi:hypothetical protein
MPFLRPAYPQILKKADWDSKKGTVAKIAGRTGVGEAMAVCERAYADVKWEELELSKIPFNLRNFTKAGWDRELEQAKAQATGNLRKLVESLYKLRDVATTAAENFKRHKLIPSSSTEHAKSIAKTADQMGVSLNTNSIGRPILEDYNAVLTKVTQAAATVPTTLRSALGKMPTEIGELKRMAAATPLQVGAINSKFYTAARDLSQNSVNVQKFIEERGVPVPGFTVNELPQLKTINQALTPWANTQGGYFENNAKPDEIKRELDAFERVYNQLRALAN